MKNWKEHKLSTGMVELTWYETGEGEPLIFLHGAWDSYFYKPMAELFCSCYRCILYDQRGTSGTLLDELNDETLHIDRYFDDLEALRKELGLNQVSLVGHSWGATLGLLYASKYPERVEKLVLVGMGPLTDEMKEVYRANFIRLMRPEDRERWPQVKAEYFRAWRSGEEISKSLDRQMMEICSPVWFYSLDMAKDFVDIYLKGGGSRRLGQYARYNQEDVLANAARVKAQVLIVYGHQDYEPIAQAPLLSSKIADARIVYINRCGHIVWLEQPEEFYQSVDDFLVHE